MLDSLLIFPRPQDGHNEDVHKTALARRLLSLSEAFHLGTLTDEQIVFYADELVSVCLEQIEVFQRLQSQEGGRIPPRVLRYLEGILELAERFDYMTLYQVQREVSSLEEDLTSALISNYREAA